VFWNSLGESFSISDAIYVFGRRVAALSRTCIQSQLRACS